MSIKLPPISIGIPFFNAERFLLDAIRSVFAQTHQDWELILMDDGSTDRSLNIARSIDDSRVRVYSDGKNKKLAARLNEIHSLARFDFIARMDADDLMAPDRIEKQLLFLIEHPEFDLATTGVCSITDDSVPYGVRCVEPGHALTPYRVLSGGHGIIHASIVGKVEWFRRNPYDPTDFWGEDYNLWIRAIVGEDLSVGFIRDPLYFYREVTSATLSKILRGQKIGRKAFVNYGVEMVGLAKSGYLIGKSYVKSLAALAFWMMNNLDFLVRLRSPEIDPYLINELRENIGAVRAIRLPLVCD